MRTLGDFLHNAKITIGEQYNKAKSAMARGYDAVKSDPNATFRGQNLDPEISKVPYEGRENRVNNTVNPEVERRAPLRQTGTAVVPATNPNMGQPGPGQWTSKGPETNGLGSKPHITAGDYAKAARETAGQTESLRTAGRGATAWGAAKTAMGEAVQGPVNTAKSIKDAAVKIGKGAVGGLGWVAKKVAPVEQIANVADAASRVASDGLTYDERKNEAKRGGINMLATSIGRVGGGILGAGGGAALGSVVPFAGTVSGGAAGLVGGQAIGADLGRRTGEWIGEKFYGAPKGQGVEDRLREASDGSALRNVAVSPAAQTGTIAEPQAQPAAKSSIDWRGQKDAYGMPPLPEDATPEQAKQWLEASNVMAAQENERRTRGSGQQAGGDPLQPLRDLAAVGAGAKPGHSGFGGLAALAGYGAISRQQANATNASLRNQQIQSTANMARVKMIQDQFNKDREFGQKAEELKSTREDKADTKGNERRQKLNEQRAAIIEGGPKTSMLGDEKPDQHKSRVTQRAADIEDHLQASVADLKNGKNLNTMKPKEVQYLYRAYDNKRSLEESRPGFWQSAADYTGAKRFDSKNLYGYVPSAVTPSKVPGETWRVEMANGNTIALKELAGGKFNVLGPNSPVNSDLMEQITPLIERYKKTGK